MKISGNYTDIVTSIGGFKMAKDFSAEEHRILDFFKEGALFKMDGHEYEVVSAGKPTCFHGEPKTDIYVEAKSINNKIEIKISFKKANADFLENKTNASRAEQLFGDEWESVIENSTMQLERQFCTRPLIYKSSFGRTEAGAITLGWKFELVNKKSGQLSESLVLNNQQLYDVYAGTNLSIEKQDSNVNGRTIRKSGIANYMLIENHDFQNIQDVIDSIVPIDEYVIDNPGIYYACKALNYRSFVKKYDGNRPLAVYVRWFVRNGKLAYELCFDKPLLHGGDDAYNGLIDAMNELGIRDVDDINDDNVEDPDIIHF